MRPPYAPGKAGRAFPRPAAYRVILLSVAAVSAPGLASAAQLGGAGGVATVTGISAEQLFDAAERAKGGGDNVWAEKIYRTLSGDLKPDIRNEARFRLGLMLVAQSRYTEAGLQFRAILDEKPDAARVRIELARVLALIGDEAGARRQLRQAQAGGLPPEVALAVDQFANALRSAKPWGGSFEIALAPDSNINRATDSKTLDTVIAPLNLSDDARARSGLGLKPSGQVYLRTPLSARLTLVPRLSGQGSFYDARQFDDLSASAQIGVEWRGRRDRVTPSVGYGWRWYGEKPYARTESLSVDWLRALGPRAQITTEAGVSRANYAHNDGQDGDLYNGGVTYERALTAKTGASVSLTATRQTARDPGYATRSGGGGALFWWDAGRVTVFAAAAVNGLKADERLLLFPERRWDRYGRIALGAVFRQVQVAGFSPVLRVSYERNASTVGIYDYHRVATEVGVSRAF